MTNTKSTIASAAVRTASRRHGATLFMVLFAVFAALLERLTGEVDFLLGELDVAIEVKGSARERQVGADHPFHLRHTRPAAR